MNIEDLLCPLCSNYFNDTDRLPRVIPCCGHTFCSSCIQNIITKLEANSEFICPEDGSRMSLQAKELSVFPQNRYLFKLLEKKKNISPSIKSESSQKKNGKVKSDQSPKQTTQFSPNSDLRENIENIPPKHNQLNNSNENKLCSDHGRKLEIICLDHRCRICTNCALFGMHKNHQVKAEEEVLRDLAVRAESLLDKLQTMEEDHANFKKEDFIQEMKTKLVQTHEKLSLQIHGKFDEYVKLLLETEKMIIDDLKTKFLGISKQLLEFSKLPGDLEQRVLKWKSEAKDTLLSIHEKTEKNEIHFDFLEQKHNPKSDVIFIGERINHELKSAISYPMKNLESMLEKLKLEFDPNISDHLKNFCMIHSPDLRMDWSNFKYEEKKITEVRNSYTRSNTQLSISSPTKLSRGLNFGSANKFSNTMHELNSMLCEETPNLSRKVDLLNSQICSSIDRRIKHDTDLLGLELELRETPLINREFIMHQEGYSLENLTPVHVNFPNIKDFLNQDNLISKLADTVSISNISFSKTEEDEKLMTETSKSASGFLKDKMLLTSPNKVPPVESKLMKKKTSLKITDKFEVMMESIKADALEVGDFTGAELGDSGASRLAELLVKNKSLKSLKLLKNKIGDEGGLALAKALYQNTTLQTINLTQNLITEKTIDAFLELFQKQSTLKTIYFNQNSISLRNVKNKIKDMTKLGINVSI